MPSFPFLLLLLAAGSLAGHAQTGPVAPHDSLPQRGELTGARPSGDLLARPRAQASVPGSFQQHLLGLDVRLAQARASQLPELYEQFIATTRTERRAWSYADWDAAGQILAQLNQRYEQVRDVKGAAIKAYIVINRYTGSTKLDKEVVDVMREFGIDVMATTIGQRVAYREAPTNGLGVVEFRDPKAKDEMMRFATEVEKILSTMIHKN